MPYIRLIFLDWWNKIKFYFLYTFICTSVSLLWHLYLTLNGTMILRVGKSHLGFQIAFQCSLWYIPCCIFLGHVVLRFLCTPCSERAHLIHLHMSPEALYLVFSRNSINKMRFLKVPFHDILFGVAWEESTPSKYISIQWHLNFCITNMSATPNSAKLICYFFEWHQDGFVMIGTEWSLISAFIWGWFIENTPSLITAEN